MLKDLVVKLYMIFHVLKVKILGDMETLAMQKAMAVRLKDNILMLKDIMRLLLENLLMQRVGMQLLLETIPMLKEGLLPL